MTTETTKEFVIELNNWNYRQFKEFRKAVTDDNDDVFIPLLAMVIESWPFEGKPIAEAIANLGLIDMSALLNAVTIAAGNAFRTGRGS